MVDLEFDDGLAVLTIDRPHARNAIALDTMEQLEKAIDAAAGARTLVIKGAGDRAFVSGGDLKELATLRTEADAAAMAKRMRSICDQLATFPAPVVAALNGHAFGGGAEVAVAADIRVAADDIKIAFNQVALEIMPAWGGAERLAAIVGKSKALLLAGTGTTLDAAEAERIGLVSYVKSADELEPFVDHFVAEIASGPPVGVRFSKRLVIDGLARTYREHVVAQEYASLANRVLADHDVREGIAAFKEKRSPDFRGIVATRRWQNY